MAELDLWSMLFVFMLATFVGFQVIQNVSRLLHTPLMSLTNAISAIAIVGAIVVTGEEESTATTILGAVAVAGRAVRGAVPSLGRVLVRCALAAPAAPGGSWLAERA